MIDMKSVIRLALAWMGALTSVKALQSPYAPVSDLLSKHASTIASLKSYTTEMVGSIAEEPYSNDVFYLHFCLQDEDTATEALEKSLEWRTGHGKSICESARNALAQQGNDDDWNNEPVLNAAPFSDKIATFLNDNVLTTINPDGGDLVYMVRAGKIDDNDLMNAVSVDQMTDFFLYAKEINALVSYQRSMESNRLCNVLTANDLAGVKLMGGSSDFRTALGNSSKVAAVVYPKTINGPTLLCNLPKLLNALVKLFTPLFPESVKARLKFATLPVLADVDSLTLLSTKADTPERKTFLRELEAALAA